MFGKVDLSVSLIHAGLFIWYRSTLMYQWKVKLGLHNDLKVQLSFAKFSEKQHELHQYIKK